MSHIEPGHLGKIVIATLLWLSACFAPPVGAGPPGSSTSSGGQLSIDRSLVEVGPSLEIADEFSPVTLPLAFTAFIKAARWDVSKDSVRFVLYRNGVEVGPLATRKAHQRTTISADATATELGVYRVDVLLGDGLLGSTGFSIARVPGIGRGVMLLVGGDGHADIRFRAKTAMLELHRWESTFESHAYYVEWRHAGKVVATDKGRSGQLDEWIHALEDRLSTPEMFAKQNLNGRMYAALESYTVPPEVLRSAGAWDVVVLRDGHPAVASTFTVTPQGSLEGALMIDVGRHGVWERVALTTTTPPASPELVRKLKSVPAWKHVHVDQNVRNLLPVTPEEIRALYRSPELWEARRTFNDKILPMTGTARAELSADDRRRLTIDRQDRLIRQTEHEANTESWAKTQANRRAAIKDIPHLQQLIHQYGAPFSPDEQPR